MFHACFFRSDLPLQILHNIRRHFVGALRDQSVAWLDGYSDNYIRSHCTSEHCLASMTLTIIWRSGETSGKVCALLNEYHCNFIIFFSLASTLCHFSAWEFTSYLRKWFWHTHHGKPTKKVALKLLLTRLNFVPFPWLFCLIKTLL